MKWAFLSWRQRRGSPAFAPLCEPVVARGLLGVLLVFIALGSIHLFAIPPFAPLDEPRHIAYAIEIGEGHLADVRDHVQLEKLHVRRIQGTHMMAAAAHPPLYYLLVCLPLKWSSQSGDLTWGTWVSRGVTLLLGIAGLLYAYLAAALIVPLKRSLALSATAFCAFMPAFDNVSALVHNDSLAFLTTSALFHAVLLVVLQGPTRGALVSVGVWASLAAATRFASMIVVAPALATVGLVLLFAPGKPWSRRLSETLLIGLTLLGAVAATSGWFYLRNYRLYGDVTAAKALVEGLNRPVRTSFLHNVVTPSLWRTLVSDLWGRLAGGVKLDGTVTQLGSLFFFGGLLSALWPVLRAARARGWAMLRGKQAAAVAFLVIAAAFVVLPIFEFYSRGGNMTARYYFPVLWIPLLGVAVGYAHFKSNLPGAAALIGAALLCLLTTEVYIGQLVGLKRGGLAFDRGFARAELPAPELWVAALLVTFAVGIALILSAWSALRAAEASEAPSTPRVGQDGVAAGG